MIRRMTRKLLVFRSDTSGAAMVEFAIALPLLLLMVAVVIEASRLTWTHQAAAAGVRDAVRYIARLAPQDICSGTAAIGDFDDDATDIVTLRMGNADEQILPGGVTVVDVVADLQCMEVDYSTDDVPVVGVRVQLQIDFPFGGAFALLGRPLDPLTTIIGDESRVYGL